MYQAATNLAFFLLDQTGSVNGRWSGRMPAKQQRAMFGRFLGKGALVISGDAETVTHTVKRCFGLDWEVTAKLNWRDLQLGEPSQ